MTGISSDVMLIDVDGSMGVFHCWHRINGIQLPGKFKFYFHNCPMRYLYRDDARLDYVEIEQVLTTAVPPSESASLLIFSDAGAARGGYNQERIDLTSQFIKLCEVYFKSIIWLNPVPSTRWVGTTAGTIAEFVAMEEWRGTGPHEK